MKPLVVLGAYPHQEFLLDGWYRRISQMETCFVGIPRIYIRIDLNFHSDYLHKVELSPEIDEFTWNPFNIKQTGELNSYLESCKLIYCHTTHYAEYLYRLSFSAKVILDMHGAAPEEELMQGNFDFAKNLELVEKRVVNDCDVLVHVTDAMLDHLWRKNLHPRNTFKIPISAAFFPENDDLVLDSDRNIDYVYAGGTQKWQNIEKVVTFLNLHREATAVIATNTPHDRVFQKLRKQVQVKSKTSTELSQLYLNSNFGFVIRSNSVVNKVASPTKVFEYISHGVIPILDTIQIGDMLDLGIQYITLNELESNQMLFAKTNENFRLQNYLVSKKYHHDLILQLINFRNLVIDWTIREH